MTDYNKLIITGGNGFICCNSASYFSSKADEIVVVDNNSRKGALDNQKWLSKNHSNISFVKADISKDFDLLKKSFKDADAILHLAAQVAVTTSVANPRSDFMDNALGTFNVLEAARLSADDASIIFSSTNKVYGGMEQIKIIEGNKRYSYKDYPKGIPETETLDFHSPYGCSKGAADQYVRDYHRIYGLKTVVFRQSCIYGQRQFGIEDQGWVAWFTIASLLGKPITIYGNGKQVRDVLYAGDLIEGYELALKKIDSVKGKLFNAGGGPENTMSLLELLAFIEELNGKKPKYSFSDWRPGDQPVYISDITKISSELGWKPKTSAKEGVKKLFVWVKENIHLFKDF